MRGAAVARGRAGEARCSVIIERVPTRREKRTWRRRCSRARWTKHTQRAFSRLYKRPEIVVFDDDPSGYPAFRIHAWWQDGVGALR